MQRLSYIVDLRVRRLRFVQLAMHAIDRATRRRCNDRGARRRRHRRRRRRDAPRTDCRAAVECTRRARVGDVDCDSMCGDCRRRRVVVVVVVAVAATAVAAVEQRCDRRRQRRAATRERARDRERRVAAQQHQSPQQFDLGVARVVANVVVANVAVQHRDRQTQASHRTDDKTRACGGGGATQSLQSVDRTNEATRVTDQKQLSESRSSARGCCHANASDEKQREETRKNRGNTRPASAHALPTRAPCSVRSDVTRDFCCTCQRACTRAHESERARTQQPPQTTTRVTTNRTETTSKQRPPTCRSRRCRTPSRPKPSSFHRCCDRLQRGGESARAYTHTHTSAHARFQRAVFFSRVRFE